MIKVETVYVIDIDDVCETFGTHQSGYAFCEMAENGSYQSVDCCDSNLEELYEEKDWLAKKYGEELRYKQVMNEIQLIEQLRAFGHRGEVLVFVHW